MKRRPQTIAFWEGILPHWEVEDGRYFVTVHLRGAIPEAGHRRIRELSNQYRQHGTENCDKALELHRHVFQEMENWLDCAEHSAALATEAVAKAVVEAVQYRQHHGIWRMFEFVVMPNHIHLFFELTGGRLKPVLENFKEWTAHQAAKLIHPKPERFWQQEWFDHWSRSDEEDDRIIRYIQHNPEKAGLVKDYKTWPYGGWSMSSPGAARRLESRNVF